MGRLEKRQAGAASASVLGFILLLVAVVLTLTERCGVLTVLMGALGGAILVSGVIANGRISDQMIQNGRR